MFIELTDEERKFIGFRLALHIEDSEVALNKREKQLNRKFPEAREQINRIIKLTYTKFIPESYTGSVLLEKCKIE